MSVGPLLQVVACDLCERQMGFSVTMDPDLDALDVDGLDDDMRRMGWLVDEGRHFCATCNAGRVQ